MFQPMGMVRHKAGPGITVSMAQQQQNAAAQNQYCRDMIRLQGQEMMQVAYSATVNGTNLAGQVFNLPFRNVGLVKRFILRVDATINKAAAETQTRTKFGPANLLSNIIYTDLNNLNRINTAGWHLFTIASAKRQMVFGSAYTNDSPVAFGSNFVVIAAPATYTTNGQLVRIYYELPLTYSDFDYRGGVYAQTTQSNQQIQVTVNPNFFVGSTAVSATQAGYQSTTAVDLGTISSITFKLFIVYMDQLPVWQDGPLKGYPMLPMDDVNWAYMLNNTQQLAGVANSGTQIVYANQRNFMSTFVVYDNQGLNAGTDVSRFEIQTANLTDFLDVDPFTASLLTRNIIADDTPVGSYYFDHRKKPINTINYGQIQLIITPLSVAGAASQFLIGWESLARLAIVQTAASLGT